MTETTVHDEQTTDGIARIVERTQMTSGPDGIETETVVEAFRWERQAGVANGTRPYKLEQTGRGVLNA